MSVKHRGAERTDTGLVALGARDFTMLLSIEAVLKVHGSTCMVVEQQVEQRAWWQCSTDCSHRRHASTACQHGEAAGTRRQAAGAFRQALVSHPFRLVPAAGTCFALAETYSPWPAARKGGKGKAAGKARRREKSGGKGKAGKARRERKGGKGKAGKARRERRETP
jgi:hypothetical protein